MHEKGHWLQSFGYVLLALSISCLAGAQQDTAVRRMSVIMAAKAAPSIVTLQAALHDEDPLVRRAAARGLAGIGTPAVEALAEALDVDDFVLRRNAAMYLGEMGPTAVRHIGKALRDDHSLVREAAIGALARLRPPTKQALDLLVAAGADDDPRVQAMAVSAINAYFDVVKEIPLPVEGWKFKTDPDDVGKSEKWYEVGLDDSLWGNIGIDKFWQEYGYQYEGVGWYRKSIKLPANPDGQKAVIHFGAVDESTWLWVNGEYAGEHDIGPGGWETPFRLDISDALKWGADNQFTVRVLNTAMAGGIYQPVTIIVLKIKELK